MSLVATSLDTGGPSPSSAAVRSGRGGLVSPLSSPLASPLESSLGSRSGSSLEPSFGTVAVDVFVTKGGLLSHEDVQRMDPFVDACNLQRRLERSARLRRRNQQALSVIQNCDQSTRRSLRALRIFDGRLKGAFREDRKRTKTDFVDSPLPDVEQSVNTQRKDRKPTRNELRKRKHPSQTEKKSPPALELMTEKQTSRETKIKVQNTDTSDGSTRSLSMRCTRLQTRLFHEMERQKSDKCNSGCYELPVSRLSEKTSSQSHETENFARETVDQVAMQPVQTSYSKQRIRDGNKVTPVAMTPMVQNTHANPTDDVVSDFSFTKDAEDILSSKVFHRTDMVDKQCYLTLSAVDVQYFEDSPRRSRRLQPSSRYNMAKETPRNQIVYTSAVVKAQDVVESRRRSRRNEALQFSSSQCIATVALDASACLMTQNQAPAPPYTQRTALTSISIACEPNWPKLGSDTLPALSRSPPALPIGAARAPRTSDSILSEAWLHPTSTTLQPIWTTAIAKMGTELLTMTSLSTSQFKDTQKSSYQLAQQTTITEYGMNSPTLRCTFSSTFAASASISFAPKTVVSCLMRCSPLVQPSDYPISYSMAYTQMVHRPLPRRRNAQAVFDALSPVQSPGLAAAQIPSEWSAFHFHVRKSCVIYDALSDAALARHTQEMESKEYQELMISAEALYAAAITQNTMDIESKQHQQPMISAEEHIKQIVAFLQEDSMTNPPQLNITDTINLNDLAGLDCTSSPLPSPAGSPNVQESLHQQLSEVGDVSLVGSGPEAALFVDENSSEFIAAELLAIEAEKKDEQSNAAVGCSEDSSVCSGGSNYGSSSFYGESSDSSEASTPTSSPSRPRPSPSSPSGPQQCTVCNKVFGNGSALAKHKLTHSDERRYVCNVCSKAFKRQDHLNGHMLTHRNKKPYECTLEGCNKSYCDSRSLRRHEENHHNVKGLMVSKHKVQDTERLRAEKITRTKNILHLVSLGCDSGTNDCSSNSSDCSTMNKESCVNNYHITTDAPSSSLADQQRLVPITSDSFTSEDDTKKTKGKAVFDKSVVETRVTKVEPCSPAQLTNVEIQLKSSTGTKNLSLSSTVTANEFSHEERDPSVTLLRSPTLQRSEIKIPAPISQVQPDTRALCGLPSGTTIPLQNSCLVSPTPDMSFQVPFTNLMQQSSEINTTHTLSSVNSKSIHVDVCSIVSHSPKQKPGKTMVAESAVSRGHCLQSASNFPSISMGTGSDFGRSEDKRLEPSWPNAEGMKLNIKPISSSIQGTSQDGPEENTCLTLKCRSGGDRMAEKFSDCMPVVISRGASSKQHPSQTVCHKVEKKENGKALNQQDSSSGLSFSGQKSSDVDLTVQNKLVRGLNTLSKKVPLKSNSKSEPFVPRNISGLPINSKTPDGIATNPKAHDITDTIESKPIPCSLCNRRFKNTPALNGHMRLHGGFFKKESESKRADKRESTGPPLQTASVSVRKLINDKITKRRTGSPTVTPFQLREDSAIVIPSPAHISKVPVSSETVSTSSVLQHHNYANSSMPVVNNSFCDQLLPSVPSISARLNKSYCPLSSRNDQLLNHSEDPLLSSTIKDIAMRKTDVGSHSLTKINLMARGDERSSVSENSSVAPQLQAWPNSNPQTTKREKMSESPKLSANMDSASSAFSPSHNLSPKRARVEETFPFYKSRLRKCRRETVIPTSKPYTPAPMLNPDRAALGLYANLSTSLECPASEDNNTDNPIAAECDSFPHINVGARFQSTIPARQKDPYEFTEESECSSNEPLWRPSVLSKCTTSQVEKYLEFSCSDMIPGAGSNEEHALHILNMCKGNIHEAMARILQPKKVLSPMHPLLTYKYALTKLWNRAEVEKFVEAIKTAGKSLEIVSSEVSSKTKAECLELYYLWKCICIREYRDTKYNWHKNPRNQDDLNLCRIKQEPEGYESSEEKTVRDCGQTLIRHAKTRESPPDIHRSFTLNTTDPKVMKAEVIEVPKAEDGFLAGCQTSKKEIPYDNYQCRDNHVPKLEPILETDNSLEFDALESENILTREELGKIGITDEHICVMTQLFYQSFKPSDENENLFMEAMKLEPMNFEMKEAFKMDTTEEGPGKELAKIKGGKPHQENNPLLHETLKEFPSNKSKALNTPDRQTYFSKNIVKTPYEVDGNAAVAFHHTSQVAIVRETRQGIKQPKDEVRMLSSSSTTEDHLSTSPDSKLFVCEVADCSASFNSKAALTGHLRIHGLRKSPPPTCGAHPKGFPCDSCGKVFPKLKILYAHKKVHQKILGSTSKAMSVKKNDSCLTFTTCLSFGLSTDKGEAIHEDESICYATHGKQGVPDHVFSQDSQCVDKSSQSREPLVVTKEEAGSVGLPTIKWSGRKFLRSIFKKELGRGSAT